MSAGRTIAVTGSASGLGAATRALLEERGDRVVGVDRHDAEVVGDLSVPEGRGAAVEAIRAAAGGRLDGLVVAAGLGPHLEDRAAIVSVNYFGAVTLLDALRDDLAAARGAAVAVASVAVSTTAGVDDALVDAMVVGDEAAARARVDASRSSSAVYGASKIAVARSIRHRAETWGAAGVRLNAVAPGAFRSAMMDGILADPALGQSTRSFRVPLGGVGGIADPRQIAGAIAFLLSADASFVHGAVVFADGGADAIARPDLF